MLENVFALSILTTEKMSESESLQLIEQLECAELAQTQFIKGLISFEDYVDILELCEVDVDKYLVTIEENFATAGIII